MGNVAIGIDVGGSHLTTAAVNLDTGAVVDNTIFHSPISSEITNSGFMSALASSIDSSYRALGNGSLPKTVAGIGFAFPGPFIYDSGICKIDGVAKYEQLFGSDIRTSCVSILRDHFRVSSQSVGFINDAQAFLLGAVEENGLATQKNIGITVGTGIGAAFYRNGHIVLDGKGVPPNGYLYNKAYRSGIAEDYISTRWFLKNYPAKNVEEIARAADQGDKLANDIFHAFGMHLAVIAGDAVKNFAADNLILGGGIFHAWHHIKNGFSEEWKKQSIDTRIILNHNTEIMSIKGAVKHLSDRTSKNDTPYRKTEQILLPSHKPPVPMPGVYDIYPFYPLVGETVHTDLEDIANLLPESGNIVIDGYGGVFWNQFIDAFSVSLKSPTTEVNWYCVDAALLPSEEINKKIDAYLNSDGPESIFAKCYPGQLQDFFDPEKLAKIKPSDTGLNIIYGCGAALAGWSGPLIYVDMPKNEIQFRSRAGALKNLGGAENADAKNQYKRFYFIDWPVLNRHKEQLVDKVDYLIDGQQTAFYHWITGTAFRDTLNDMCRNAFRARPWFEPGVWGGHWLKDRIPLLAKNTPNYAWSFELITPENGILLGSHGSLIEISFDWLMYFRSREVLGKAFEKFGTYFPIRFDYLDTVEGDNLSIQCHPSPRYAKENFGEMITQDETYYILDQKDDSGVYIGFTESSDPESFNNAIRASYESNAPMDVTEHVKFIPSKKHDLFLIPNRTIHSAGINNLVLEISSTPYIFTFKLYDWVRKDLEGNPRPINIAHGIKNLDYARKGERVQKELVSKPVLINKSADFAHWHLPTHNEHFYDIERYEFKSSLDIKTDGQCHILMLVEGSRIKVITGNRETVYNYAETFVVPAAAESYTVTNLDGGIAKLVKAFVKNSFCNK